MSVQPPSRGGRPPGIRQPKGQAPSKGGLLRKAISSFSHFIWNITGRFVTHEATFSNWKEKKTLIEDLSKKLGGDKAENQKTYAYLLKGFNLSQLKELQSNSKTIKILKETDLKEFQTNALKLIANPPSEPSPPPKVEKSPPVATPKEDFRYEDMMEEVKKGDIHEWEGGWYALTPEPPATTVKPFLHLTYVEKSVVAEVKKGLSKGKHVFSHQIALPIKGERGFYYSSEMRIEKQDDVYVLTLKVGQKELEHTVFLPDNPSDQDIEFAILYARIAWVREGV